MQRQRGRLALDQEQERRTQPNDRNGGDARDRGGSGVPGPGCPNSLPSLLLYPSGGFQPETFLRPSSTAIAVDDLERRREGGLPHGPVGRTAQAPIGRTALVDWGISPFAPQKLLAFHGDSLSESTCVHPWAGVRRCACRSVFFSFVSKPVVAGGVPALPRQPGSQSRPNQQRRT